MWSQEPTFHVYLRVLSLLSRFCPLHTGPTRAPPTFRDAPPWPGPAQVWPRPAPPRYGPAPCLIPPHAWPRPLPGATLADLGLWRRWSCTQARLQLPHHHLPLPLRDGSAALIPRGHQPVEVA